jgi:hypothetical protein
MIMNTDSSSAKATTHKEADPAKQVGCLNNLDVKNQTDQVAKVSEKSGRRIFWVL